MTRTPIYTYVETIKQIYKDCGDAEFNGTMTTANLKGIKGCHDRGWVFRGEKTRSPGERYYTRKWRLTDLGVKIATGERKR